MHRTDPAASGTDGGRQVYHKPAVLALSILLAIVCSPIAIVPRTPLVGTGWTLGACLLVGLALGLVYKRRTRWSGGDRAPHRGMFPGWSFEGLAIGLVGLIGGGLAVPLFAIPQEGASACQRAVERAAHLGVDGHIVRSVFGTRVYEDDWIAGAEAVPQGLGAGGGAVLVVCHYTPGSLDSPLRFELLDPAQREHVMRVSQPLYRSWWPHPD